MGVPPVVQSPLPQAAINAEQARGLARGRSTGALLSPDKLQIMLRSKVFEDRGFEHRRMQLAFRVGVEGSRTLASGRLEGNPLASANERFSELKAHFEHRECIGRTQH